MNDQKAKEWLLNDVYKSIGCTKTDISRWRNHSFSTHAAVKQHKIEVIRKAADLFGLSVIQGEILANKAGLSLHPLENGLADLLGKCSREQRRLLYHTAVSERMVQYYIAGKEATKQSLIAIAVLFELSVPDIEKLLGQYGHCLSYSVEYDLIIRWGLENGSMHNSGVMLLYFINDILDSVPLPMLMTKTIHR